MIQKRPAETTAIASAAALLIAYFLGVKDPAIVLAFGVVIGCIPGAVTWAMTQKRGETTIHYGGHAAQPRQDPREPPLAH